LGGRKGIWPVKTEWWGAGVVVCMEQGADNSTEPKNVPAGTDVLGKCKSVPGKIKIRASIFTSIFMLFT